MTDIRKKLESYLGSLTVDPVKWTKVEEMLDRALGQTKGSWQLVTCKHCNRQGKYFLEMPVTSAQIRGLKDLIETTLGKLPEQHDVNVHYDETPMHEIPTEELLKRIARAEAARRAEVIDGEFTELDPPQLPRASGQD